MIKKHPLGDGRRIKVLMYHRVNLDEDATSSDYSIDASTFRRQMEFLDAKGFQTITFQEYQQFLDGKRDLPRKPVIITFDDGYRSVHDVVVPIMKRLGMKAVVFVVANSNLKVNVWDASPGKELWELMNEQQILEVQESGFEIGSHTLTHRVLPSLSVAEARKEITRSRAVLEDLLSLSGS
jgi:peptidoglycan/xylan/chitin deacetylase (PgdA/CDA1 family)